MHAWWPNFDKKATLNGKYVQYLLHLPRRPQASTMSSDTIPGDSEEREEHSFFMMQDLAFFGKERRGDGPFLFRTLRDMNVAIPERRLFRLKRLMSMFALILREWVARRRDIAGEAGPPPPSPGPPRSCV